MDADCKPVGWKKSTISLKYPTYRDIPLKTVYSWLAGKRVDDNAENLWRIHNVIYDFTDFIEKHPGGTSWLQQTKGTDITEAFEVHHISTLPEKMLNKYKVRDALKPRNMRFTFKEDGFYRTLKKRVREKLKEVDHSPSKRSDLINTSLLIMTYLLAVESAAINSYVLAVMSGLLLCWTVISAHNYFHKRDNWRMYTFNISFMNFRDWRVSHAFSHHLYTNSFHDLECSMFEPFFCWIPNPDMKNWFQRYGSWIYGPGIYAFVFISQIAMRVLYSITQENMLHWDDLLAFTLPLTMLIFSGRGFIEVMIMWIIIFTIGSFIFGVIGLNAAHHHPDIVHDGDMLRKDLDWGLYQLDAVTDRSDLQGSQFLVLTHFGDHSLHHLFPTLDHGILPQLYPIFFDTIAEFRGQFRDCPWIEHIIGQNKQLARIKPKKIPPAEEVLNRFVSPQNSVDVRENSVDDYLRHSIRPFRNYIDSGIFNF